MKFISNKLMSKLEWGIAIGIVGATVACICYAEHKRCAEMSRINRRNERKSEAKSTPKRKLKSVAFIGAAGSGKSTATRIW